MGVESDKGGYRQINKSLNICAFEDYLEGQAKTLPTLADVEWLSPLVLRILGQNPGKFTFQGTNTFIIGNGKKRILIDTGGGEPAWANLISEQLEALDIELSHVLLTHWHGDHTQGVPDLLELYPDLKDSIYKNAPDHDQQPIEDDQIFGVEGATVRAVFTPGHAEDHMCFVLEEESAMFTGDNVLGHGTSAVEDLGVFMDSLEKMLLQGCKTGHPAHSSTIGDLRTKITQELAAKKRRERQVMQVLNRIRSTKRSLTLRDLVTEIYGKDLNKETRDLAIEPFVGEVLKKLATDGLVAFEKRGKAEKKWFSLVKTSEKPASPKPTPRPNLISRVSSALTRKVSPEEKTTRPGLVSRMSSTVRTWGDRPAPSTRPNMMKRLSSTLGGLLKT